MLKAPFCAHGTHSQHGDRHYSHDFTTESSTMAEEEKHAYDATNAEVNHDLAVEPKYNTKVHWFRSTFAQVFITGMVSFLAPGA